MTDRESQQSLFDRWVPGGAWRHIKKPFMSVVLFSAVANLLLLTSPLFMLQIYDRVLTSHSVPTLVALTLLAVLLIGFFVMLDMVRQRVLARIGIKVHRLLAMPVFRRAITMITENDVANRNQLVVDHKG